MQKNNQKERFEFPHATQGCEWAIAAPIITIVVVALIGAIISSASGIAIEILGANPIYLCIGSALTELSFLIAALSISKFNKVNYLSASGVKVSTPWWTYVGAIVISILVLVLLNPIINCWQVLLDTIGHQSSEIPITVDTVAKEIWNAPSRAYQCVILRTYAYESSTVSIYFLLRNSIWFSGILHTKPLAECHYALCKQC